MTQTYTAIPCNSRALFNDKVDANALHVLLWAPQIPDHYVVYDGNQYWFFKPTLGWASRREFKGAIDYLRFLPRHSAWLLDLPFKVRDMDAIYYDVSYQYWYQYHGLHQHHQAD